MLKFGGVKASAILVGNFMEILHGIDQCSKKNGPHNAQNDLQEFAFFQFVVDFFEVSFSQNPLYLRRVSIEDILHFGHQTLDFVVMSGRSRSFPRSSHQGELASGKVHEA